MTHPEQNVRARWAVELDDTARQMADHIRDGGGKEPMGLPSRMKPLILATRGVLEDAIEYKRKCTERLRAEQERKATGDSAEAADGEQADPPPEAEALPDARTPRRRARPLPDAPGPSC